MVQEDGPFDANGPLSRTPWPLRRERLGPGERPLIENGEENGPFDDEGDPEEEMLGSEANHVVGAGNTASAGDTSPNILPVLTLPLDPRILFLLKLVLEEADAAEENGLEFLQKTPLELALLFLERHETYQNRDGLLLAARAFRAFVAGNEFLGPRIDKQDGRELPGWSFDVDHARQRLEEPLSWRPKYFARIEKRAMENKKKEEKKKKREDKAKQKQKVEAGTKMVENEKSGAVASKKRVKKEQEKDSFFSDEEGDSRESKKLKKGDVSPSPKGAAGVNVKQGPGL